MESHETKGYWASMDHLTQEEIQALNRAWERLEKLADFCGESHNLKTCLWHEWTTRGQRYAKLLLLQEVAAGLRDKEVHILPKMGHQHVGCLWARALGVTGGDTWGACHPEELEEFREAIPAALKLLRGSIRFIPWDNRPTLQP